MNADDRGESAGEQTEHLLKILIVGDGNVGKSSFVHRYVSGQFNKTYRMTVGVDFSVKLLHWSDKEKVRLQLWDIAGTKKLPLVVPRILKS
uniref:RAB29, member RAS oncogene family n=1 Tax=Amphilophus citrinellus TaxID=61819 RepID=A0A3Q0SM48_AMPCI